MYFPQQPKFFPKIQTRLFQKCISGKSKSLPCANQSPLGIWKSLSVFLTHYPATQIFPQSHKNSVSTWGKSISIPCANQSQLATRVYQYFIATPQQHRIFHKAINKLRSKSLPCLNTHSWQCGRVYPYFPLPSPAT